QRGQAEGPGRGVVAGAVAVPRPAGGAGAGPAAGQGGGDGSLPGGGLEVRGRRPDPPDGPAGRGAGVALRGRFRYHAPMEKPPPLTYRDAGLDLDAYERTLSAMAPLVKRTHSPRVLDGFGGFASLFSLDFNTRLFARNYQHPVLVSGADGVGTKLKVAILANKHDTVGIDLVAMSVNDCLCT